MISALHGISLPYFLFIYSAPVGDLTLYTALDPAPTFDYIKKSFYSFVFVFNPLQFRGLLEHKMATTSTFPSTVPKKAKTSTAILSRLWNQRRMRCTQQGYTLLGKDRYHLVIESFSVWLEKGIFFACLSKKAFRSLVGHSPFLYSLVYMHGLNALYCRLTFVATNLTNLTVPIPSKIRFTCHTHN